MGHCNHGFVAVLFLWTIFNHLDLGTATVETVTNPVLSVRPVPQDAGTSDALISYRSSSATGFDPWVTSLRTFLDVYRTPGMDSQRSAIIRNCAYEMPPPPGGVCDIDVRHWSPCIPENHFSYHRASPCIFLKLDTPPGWKPEFYNDTNSLPVAMPSDLKSYILSLASRNVYELNTVWVSCEGVYPADIEFFGPVQYLPSRGIPGYLLLNNEVDGYLSPLVALHIERPASGVLINIKCKAWARNIDNNNAQGVVQFGLLID